MKGYYKLHEDGQYADMAPCGTCIHKGKMTVEAPCYNCISPEDLASHKPNAEIEFVNYEEER